MIKKKEKIKFLDFLIALVVIYSIMPIVARFISVYLTTFFYMGIILIIIALIFYNDAVTDLSKFIAVIFPFILYYVLTYITKTDSLIYWGFGILIDVVFVFIGYSVSKRNNLKNRDYFILIILLIALIITFITTIIGSFTHENAARYLATVAEADEELAVMYDWENIGGFSFVYIFVLLYPFAIFAFKKGKIKWYIAALFTVAAFMICIYTEYTIALLLVTISTLLYFVKRDLKVLDIIILLFFAILISVALSNIIAGWLESAADVIKSKNISERLEGLSIGLKGGDYESAFDDNRIDLYLRSINTFLEHPILGAMLSGGRLGGHSFILDFIGQYGIIGLIVLVWMYYIIFKTFYYPYRNVKGFGFIVWIFSQCILLSILNTGMWLFVLTVCAPYLLRWICLGGSR